MKQAKQFIDLLYFAVRDMASKLATKIVKELS